MPVMLEAEFIKLIKTLLPDFQVRLAPDKVEGGACRLVTVRAQHFPIQNVLGCKSVFDVEVFDVSTQAALQTASSLACQIQDAFDNGGLGFVSTLRMVSLPSLTPNSLSSKMHIAGFSFYTVGHYRR